MNDLQKERKKFVNSNFSPVLLLLLAEELEKRGCGNDNYDYVDYYHDQYGDIYGCIDEVVVTPDDVSWGDDNWENDYINNMGQDEYPDYTDGSGGSSGNRSDQNSEQFDVNRGRDLVEHIERGDVNVKMTSEVADFLSLTETITSLVPTVANMVKEDIGLLGKIGNWTGGLNTAYSAYSVFVGFTDGEISWQDIMNAGSLAFGIGSFFVPGLGLVSIGLGIAGIVAPGDQGNDQNPSGSGWQY